MTDEPFESTDSVRTARPLPHAQRVTFERPLALERGGQLPSVTVVYETYGQLSAARDNAVLVCHALSGDSHVAQHDPDDDPGWWDLVVGPGKTIDTNRYFVICPNVLGGCRGTTGPNSLNPETGRPYGGDFPIITVGDIVRTQQRLVEHLGIEQLLAVVGGSLGGHMALDWATRFPQRLRGVAALATSPRLTSQALAFDIVGRNAIHCDPAYHQGQYYGKGPGPTVGLALARMLGHITYLSREAMIEKFDTRRLEPYQIQTQFETKFAVGSYLAHQGDKFVERFDANSYLALSMAMDLFNLGDTPERLVEKLGASRCRWLLVSYTSDWLFPSFQSQEIVDALIASDRPVSYCNIATNCGHDAFLLPNELPMYGGMVEAFLRNLDDAPAAVAAEPQPPAAVAEADAGDAPRNGFYQRLDNDWIISLIGPGSSVLDLGCGSGGLLARLRRNGHERLVGVELDEQAILDCVRQGLNVVQANLNLGLSGFSDNQFDFVVLSQTLQAVVDVQRVIGEMLRIGRQGIVSFPNLAHHALRAQLAEEGRAPQPDGSEGYSWYNTPNLRQLSIVDFERFCAEHGIRILQRIALDTQSNRVVFDDPNRNADVALFVISH